MSETLSTLIAFIGFLIVFSMLVQAVQEGFKNVLKLKTGVWERFFINLYKKDFFSIEDRKEKIPDTKSTLFWKRKRISGKFIGEFDERLKRLKEIVGKSETLINNLKSSLNNVIKLDPNDTNIQKQILVEIKPLLDAMEQVAVLKLDVLLNIYDEFQNWKIKAVFRKIGTLIEANTKLRDNIMTFKKKEIIDFQKRCEELLNKIKEIEGMLSDYRFQIENNIDAWIAQVNEEYRRNMLLWTILTGFILVFIFNADSFNIYKYLSVDSKARAAIIQKVSETASKIQKANADELNTIESALRQDKIDEAKDAILKLSKNLQEDFTLYEDMNNVEKIKNIVKEIEGLSAEELGKEQKLALLKDKEGDLSKLYLELQKLSIDYQLGHLTALDLPLGWTADYKEITSAKGNMLIYFAVKKIGGLTLTILLVTFGAPFWNDVLGALFGIKTMTLKRDVSLK